MRHPQNLHDILLVEDDDDHAALLEFVLSSIDTDLVLSRVVDGRQAIDRILCQGPYADLRPPDLVLLDLNLPRVDGISVLETVRDEARSVPIVMLTTSNAETDRRRAYEGGINSYLVKPMAFDELEELMADVLRYWGRWNRTAPRAGLPSAA